MSASPFTDVGGYFERYLVRRSGQSRSASAFASSTEMKVATYARIRPKLPTGEDLANAANAGTQPIADWLEQVVASGGLGKVGPRITTLVRAMGIRTYPLFAKGDSSEVLWFREYPYNSVNAEIECALALAAIAESGGLRRIRRCQLSDCRKFFFGDPRAKWCSNACGSKSRKRKSRKSRIAVL
jgi:hypothetical protein